MLMFDLSVENAQEFFERCMKREANTLEERLEILREMAEEGKIKRIMATDRTPDQVAKDLSKHYDNVLIIKPKKKNGKPS